MNVVCLAPMRTELWDWESLPGATTIASDALLETKSWTRVRAQGISIGCDALFSTQTQFADEQNQTRNHDYVGRRCEKETGYHALKMNSGCHALKETPADGLEHEMAMTQRSGLDQGCLPSEQIEQRWKLIRWDQAQVHLIN